MNNKIKIGLGIRTSESYLIERAYDLFKNKTIDFVEIVINQPKLKKAISDFKSYKIPYTFHGPYENCGVNIADPRKEKSNISNIKGAIKFVKELNGNFMILHPGYLENPKCSREQSLKVLKMLSLEFPILLENNPFYGWKNEKMFFSTPKEIRNVVPAYCGLCLDFTHAYTVSTKLGKKPEKLFKEFLKIKPLHFHLSGGMTKNTRESPVYLEKSDFNFNLIKTIILKSKIKTLTIETPRKNSSSLEENIADINYFRESK